MKPYFLVMLFLISNEAIRSKSVPYVGNPIVESCVACKFIWENIEEALMDNSSGFLESDSSRRNPILAAQAFQYFCRIAPDLFFEPCNIMFEKLFFMTQDFCAKKRILDICIDNELCSRND